MDSANLYGDRIAHPHPVKKGWAIHLNTCKGDEMTELTKKLIGFDEDLLQKLEKYAKDNKISFTVAVRTLLEKALDQDTPNESEGEGDSVDIPSLDKRLAKLEKDFSFWNADETQSKLGNIQLQVNDIEKKLNTIIAVSKKFKGHINNREIHLED